MKAVTQERIRLVIAECLYVNDDEITSDATFEDLDADSLDFVELVMELEDKFDIEIPEDDADKWRTMGDVVLYVLAKCNLALVQNAKR